MLTSISIQNFGIIETLEVDFIKGLNILTGETGAGKSILIDALRLALGERFQNSFMRDGAQQCHVEAVFLFADDFFNQYDDLKDFLHDEGSLIIQRTVSLDGKNKIKINGSSVTLSQLKTIGRLIIDFHGPYDHQQLLAEQHHMAILDALTHFSPDFEKYQKTYQEYLNCQSALKKLEDQALSRERDLDLLAHQIQELEQVPLNEEHAELIEQQKLKIHHAQKLHQYLQTALQILENTEAPIHSIISKTFTPLTQLSQIDEKTSPFLDQLTLLETTTQDLLSDLRSYADSLSFHQEEADAIHQQADIYTRIRKKFGPTLLDAQNFYQQAREKFLALESFEENREGLIEKIADHEKSLTVLANAITKDRIKTAKMLKKTIEKELQELGFKSIVFETVFEPIPFSLLGNQKAIFYISTNKGESLKPLADIISSGEAARLMLAIKRALMKVDTIPILIFDEIDAQIGGRLSSIVGQKLKEISQFRQVLLITHAPQIAAFADHHLKITKFIEKDRTQTKVFSLSQQQRVQELAEMMTGESTTKTAIQHAKELLAQVQSI